MTTTAHAIASAAIARPADEVWTVLRRFEDLTWAMGKGVEGGMPGLDGYTATASVVPTPGGCEVRWECRARTEERSLLEALASGLVSAFSSWFA